MEKQFNEKFEKFKQNPIEHIYKQEFYLFMESIIKENKYFDNVKLCHILECISKVIYKQKKKNHFIELLMVAFEKYKTQECKEILCSAMVSCSMNDLNCVEMLVNQMRWFDPLMQVLNDHKCVKSKNFCQNMYIFIHSMKRYDSFLIEVHKNHISQHFDFWINTGFLETN